MPCTCIPGGHFACYGDLEKGAYRVVLHGHGHVKFLLRVRYKQDFSVGRKCLCCY